MAVFLALLEEALQQEVALTTITTIITPITQRVADFSTSDKVGVCFLLFIFRSDPHVLQVCLSSNTCTEYTEAQFIMVFVLAPDPTLSSQQYPQQEAAQSRGEYDIPNYAHSGWPVNTSKFATIFIIMNADVDLFI